MPYVDSEGPAQHAHLFSLIWPFSVRRHILQYPLILLAGNEGPDQTAQISSLIWAYVVRKVHKDPFCALRIICCGYSLEVPRGGASNEYPQHKSSWKNKKELGASNGYLQHMSSWKPKKKIC